MLHSPGKPKRKPHSPHINTPPNRSKDNSPSVATTSSPTRVPESKRTNLPPGGHEDKQDSKRFNADLSPNSDLKDLLGSNKAAKSRDPARAQQPLTIDTGGNNNNPARSSGGGIKKTIEPPVTASSGN